MKNNMLPDSNFQYHLSPELNNTMLKILSFHKKQNYPNSTTQTGLWFWIDQLN